MFPFNFLSQPINAELYALLVASPLNEEEKQGWLEILPLMHDEEKNVLMKNLREEVNAYAKAEKQNYALLQQEIQLTR